MADHNLFSVTEEQPTRVDVVLNKIKQLLIEQKLSPAEMIPSEHILADKLKVSRGSVREAMKILSAFGIVDIRRGNGTYVSTASNKRLFDPLLFQILIQNRDYQSLIEVRQVLEEGILRLLVKNASDDELKDLDEVHREFERCRADKNSALEECNALDLVYHQKTGKYSHNAILYTMYNFLIELFSPTINSKQSGAKEIHRELHSALMARNEEGALAAIMKHTQVWVKANMEKNE